ncbi:type ISP restriction/modification enzyme [Sphaerisporangium sp. NPDC049002]
MYVYFWRWATWKVFDAHPEQPAGVVTLITPSSYIDGPGFAEMRSYLRRSADEGWIIDLSPEQHQPDGSTRVFPGVQQNLCIGVFVRYGPVDRNTPARVRYMAVTGHREQKFARLASVSIDDSCWKACDTGWRDPFTPAAGDRWLSYLALTDLFPWALTGITPNRNWVHAPDKETLNRRWARLIDAGPDEKRILMKETTDRDLTDLPGALPGEPPPAHPLDVETCRNPRTEPVALRSFDRQHVIYDARVIDRPRPALWAVRGQRQIYATEQHSQPITSGPALTFASLVPSAHHYNGRGGRVLPLYRDALGLQPNLTPGLLESIGLRIGKTISADDLMAYVAALSAHPSYTSRFAEELKNPGLRIPLTADSEAWDEGVHIGRRVLWLHTYGERCADAGEGRPLGPPKLPPAVRPKARVTIPYTEESMPETISYDATTRTLHVGAGEISPVSPQVWDYEISGWKVVRRWFGYRRANPGGNRSSPLDSINIGRWPAQFTTELLELLNVLSLCVELEPAQAVLLEKICDGPLITAADLEQRKVLPAPANVRKAPQVEADHAPRLF